MQIPLGTMPAMTHRRGAND